MVEMSFTVQNAFRYDGSFPSFRQPSEVGCYSLNSERNFCDDIHQLKYLVMPHAISGLRMDLNEGYGDVINKDFALQERIDVLLKWILKHQDEVKTVFRSPNADKIKIDFVCFRGLLTSICATIYENKEDWIICATKFRSVIYLCAYDTAQAIQRREKMTDTEKLTTSWGFKFEQCMTSDTRNSEPNTSVPVNEKEEYCVMLKGKLNDHTLLFSAEVDGEDPTYFRQSGNDPKSTSRYTELKTSRIITTEGQDWNFCRYKLLKWWVQSFLVGIPRIICGFRDENGIVRNIRIFHLRAISRMAENLWSPSACLNFCSQFLDHLKSVVVKDNPYVVYKFYWKPGCDITCEELESSAEYQILPEWYISSLNI